MVLRLSLDDRALLVFIISRGVESWAMFWWWDKNSSNIRLSAPGPNRYYYYLGCHDLDNIIMMEQGKKPRDENDCIYIALHLCGLSQPTPLPFDPHPSPHS